MIEAVIFDMDGVLADTEYYYENRRKNFLLENGIPIPEGNFIGSNEKAIWEAIVPNDPVRRQEMLMAYREYRKARPTPYGKLTDPLKIRLKTKNYAPSPMGEGGRGSDRGRMRGDLPASTRKRAATITLPSSVRFADSFSLRAKSRLRRLRSDTRLRAQPRGGSLFVGAGHAPPATEKQPPVIGRPRKAAGRACPAPTFIVRGIFYDLHR